MNPNLCELCKHKDHPDDGWCYMFQLEPTGPCLQHSVSAVRGINARIEAINRIMKAIK